MDIQVVDAETGSQFLLEDAAIKVDISYLWNMSNLESGNIKDHISSMTVNPLPSHTRRWTILRMSG